MRFSNALKFAGLATLASSAGLDFEAAAAKKPKKPTLMEVAHDRKIGWDSCEKDKTAVARARDDFSARLDIASEGFGKCAEEKGEKENALGLANTRAEGAEKTRDENARKLSTGESTKTNLEIILGLLAAAAATTIALLQMSRSKCKGELATSKSKNAAKGFELADAESRARQLGRVNEAQRERLEGFEVNMEPLFRKLEVLTSIRIDATMPSGAGGVKPDRLASLQASLKAVETIQDGALGPDVFLYLASSHLQRLDEKINEALFILRQSNPNPTDADQKVIAEFKEKKATLKALLDSGNRQEAIDEAYTILAGIKMLEQRMVQ